MVFNKHTLGGRNSCRTPELRETEGELDKLFHELDGLAAATHRVIAKSDSGTIHRGSKDYVSGGINEGRATWCI